MKSFRYVYKVIWLYLLSVVLLLSGALFVHSQNIAFTQITPPKEAPFPFQITGITQDTLGYMWFTSGPVLYRYDGYEFTMYKNDPLNPNSLAGERLECIYADKSGFIWVGDFGHGLNRLDPRTGIFMHYRHNKSDASSISNDTVTVITQDHEGYIWVGTLGGLCRLDQKTGKFTCYQQKANDPASLSNNRVWAIYEDRQGTIWVGTGNSFSFDGTLQGEGGLNRLDKKSGTFTRYMHNPKDINSLIDNKVRAIYEDSRGNFWVGTAGDGLHTMDRAKGTFLRHLYDPAHPEKLSRPYLKRRRTEDGVTFIHEDAMGYIWIGTYKGGLNRYNPATRLVSHYEGRRQTDSLFDDGPWAIYSSRDGVIWMSTVNANNLYRINPFQKRIPHYALPEGTVNSFVDEPGNILWIGTVKGLLRYDRNKESIRRFVNDPNDPSSLSHNTINSIAKDKEGNIWIGTNKGLNMLNRDKQTFTRYQHNPKNSNSLFSDYIFEALVDSESNLWLVTSNGLDHLNRRTGKFTHYLIDPKDTSNSGIFQNGWNKLLVYGYGFRQLDQKNSKFKTNQNLGDLLTLYTDTDNVLWIGSTNGISRYNPALDSFLLFEDPGFSNLIKNVCNILEDDHKNLWLSVSDGIMRINAKRNQTSLYGVKYGIPSFTNIAFHSGYKGQDGEFFFGNSTGFYSFFPDEFTRSSTPPQININNFRLANQLVKPTKNGPLFQPLSEVKEIRLNYDQNVFSFDFAGINYSSPEDNIHLFMLEGYNTTWRQAGAERTAYYFNVPPGNYVFRVRAASSNGIWAEKHIDLVITPPWWSTWWFYTFCIISASSVIYILFRYRLNQKLKAYELRNTISRDLHDEVGSTLSSIGFLSSMALEDVNNNQEKAHTTLTSINESANKMLDAMNDIIWNIQPQNDTLENIIVRMISFASELLEAKKINLNFNVEDNIKQLRLGLKVRHDFLIIYKEAINNLAKYSAATTANICLKYQQPYLTLTISDNGRGFDTNSIRHNGNGLKNMQTRARKIGAVYHLNTVPGQGTTITLQVRPT